MFAPSRRTASSASYSWTALSSRLKSQAARLNHWKTDIRSNRRTSIECPSLMCAFSCSRICLMHLFPAQKALETEVERDEDQRDFQLV